MVSVTLRCRGSPRNRGRSSTSMLPSSRLTISAMLIVRARAPAISMASGRPSTRRHSSTTAGRSVEPTAAPASRQRSRNSCTDGHDSGSPSGRGTASGARDSTDSPGMSRGERLVARIVGCWQAPRICTSQCAAASSRCSQLSTTRSTGRSAGELSSALNESNPSCAARAPGTPASSSTRVRSTYPVPIENIGATVTAPARASAVLPTPPGPTTVTSRLVRNRSSSSCSSRSRPTSAPGAMSPW